MTSAATTTKVLDGFAAAWAVTASAEGAGRVDEVIGSLRTYVDARGAAAIDDLTAYRLTHDAGRAPTEHELAAVLAVIEHVPGFFQTLASRSEPTDLPAAADVVRDLALWLVERRLVDADVARHLERYTHLYDEGRRTGT